MSGEFHTINRQELAEILKMARNLVEGDLSREIQASLSGELEKLSSYLNQALNSIKLINSEISEFAGKVPTAISHLESIRRDTEESSSTILDSLEEIFELQGEIANASQDAVPQEKSLSKIRELTQKSTEKISDVMSALAFSDLLVQKVKKVSLILEETAQRLEKLLDVLGIKVESQDSECSFVAKRLAQDLVDDLIRTLRAG